MKRRLAHHQHDAAPFLHGDVGRPATLDDIVDHSVGRALDLFGIRVDGVHRWQGKRRPVS